MTDLIPIHGLAVSPPVLLVHPSRPYKTLAHLIEFAKKNPGAVNYGTSGVGTTAHLAAELLQQVASIKLTHVPYKGSGAALTDLMAGVLDLSVDFPATTLQSIEAGKVSAMVVFSDARIGVLGHVPTTREAGYAGTQLGSWSGVFVPKGTPGDVLDKLEDAFHRALRNQGVMKYYSDAGQTIYGDMTAPAFREFVGQEARRIEVLVEKSGAKAF